MQASMCKQLQVLTGYLRPFLFPTFPGMFPLFFFPLPHCPQPFNSFQSTSKRLVKCSPNSVMTINYWKKNKITPVSRGKKDQKLWSDSGQVLHYQSCCNRALCSSTDVAFLVQLQNRKTRRKQFIQVTPFFFFFFQLSYLIWVTFEMKN